jgi:hypothetical protein
MKSKQTFEELILGFDARILENERVSIWSGERRSDFLLRPDVLQPFSTDPLVWPSIFQVCEIFRQSYVGFYDDLWENLEQLKEYIQKKVHVPLPSYCIVAITLATGILNHGEREMWEEHLTGVIPVEQGWQKVTSISAANPSIPADSWVLLGYDVSDIHGLSGLSNCAFVPEIEDPQGIRNTWRPHINKFHLFEELDKALNFRIISNERVKEHAPFFVFGIWLIEEHRF